MVTDRTQLHTAQEHGDGSILKHVNELIDSLEAKGMKPILRDEQGDGGWEYVGAYSEDGNGGVERF